MKECKPEDLLEIDENNLLKNFSRIENSYSNSSEIEKITHFLLNQDIGAEDLTYNIILDYYHQKLTENKKLIDFALEWIRAKKIRFEYKKYLANAQFNDYEIAIDECIFRFFLNYDKYIRNLFFDRIKEFELCVLYEIFFNPNLSEKFNLKNTLEKYKLEVPTIFYESKRVNTNIVTLRAALSEIIKKDYESISKKSIIKISKESKIEVKKALTEKENKKFSGPHLERIIKSYIITNNVDSLKDLDKAIGQFLGSYLKFGKLYRYSNFIQPLENSLMEILQNILTDQVQEKIDFKHLKHQFKKALEKTHDKNTIKELDGSAWKKDLSLLLKNYIEKILGNLNQ